jgi:chaperone BCS1
MESLYLNGDLKQRLETLISKFYVNEMFYVRFGRRWKKVVLLHGPPGTGKSSIIRALATKFNLHLYNMTIDKTMTGMVLETLINQVPKQSILMIEDVDCLFAGREGSGTHAIDISSVLNVLDGVSTPEGILIVMTTNHLSKLDPALIRPGRIDFRAEIGWPEPAHFIRYLEEVVPEFKQEHAAVVDHIAKNVPKCTIACLQKYVFDSVELDRKTLLDNLNEIESIEF